MIQELVNVMRNSISVGVSAINLLLNSPTFLSNTVQIPVKNVTPQIQSMFKKRIDLILNSSEFIQWPPNTGKKFYDIPSIINYFASRAVPHGPNITCK